MAAISVVQSLLDHHFVLDAFRCEGIAVEVAVADVDDRVRIAMGEESRRRLLGNLLVQRQAVDLFGAFVTAQNDVPHLLCRLILRNFLAEIDTGINEDGEVRLAEGIGDRITLE